MKKLLSLVMISWASQSIAQDGSIFGSMICDVVASKTVAANEQIAVNRNMNDFPSGMSLKLEYALADGAGLSIALFETDSGIRLIQEAFPVETFRGISPYSNLAEFRASYSEASIGRFGINYKGSDQLFIKNGCGNENWRGHFVQTYVGGHSTQVVSLDCRPVRNVADEFFSRLKASL
jgi:hypothetical protein